MNSSVQGLVLSHVCTECFFGEGGGKVDLKILYSDFFFPAPEYHDTVCYKLRGQLFEIFHSVDRNYHIYI